MLKESFFPTSFWFLKNQEISWAKKLSFNHILKECLISKDLQIIRKKAETVLISVHSSNIAENFNAFETWSSESTRCYNHLKKQASHFTSLVALKSESYLPKKFFFICFNESPLKIMKNAFYFILKALFVLKIFKFLSWHFGQVEETA